MKRNGDVRLAAVPQEAAAMLELTRVDHIFETFDSTADAVNSFDQFPTTSFQQVRGHECSPLPLQARHGFEDGQSDSGAGLQVSQLTVKTSGRWLRRQIAGCLLLLLVAPFATAEPFPQQEPPPNQQAGSATSTKPQATTSGSDATAVQAGSSQIEPSQIEPPQSESLPNSPGTVRSQDGLSSVQQSSPKLQNGAQEPLGTAAAPSVKTTGVAASRPAGAAIAPAKQRRARSILIKVGAIVGAGVAVATVVALSSASPSRPPGSH